MLLYGLVFKSNTLSFGVTCSSASTSQENGKAAEFTEREIVAVANLTVIC